jgi:hypothetical protein
MEPSRLSKYSDHILVCSASFDVLSSCWRRYFSTSAFKGTAVQILYLYAAKTKKKNLQKTFFAHDKEVP